MSSTLLKEAERVMGICNACRYCEGFCAVFPAMERRRGFTAQDLKYLANLCHNCRGCYYACQYAPPHEFDVNVPKTLGELRLETYPEFSWPASLKGLFQNNAWWVWLITVGSVTTVMLLTILFQGPTVFFSIHIGANAFYRIIPLALIVLPLSAVTLFILYSLWRGLSRFWRVTGGQAGELFDLRANRQALGDALGLKYLDGGGHGCNYPDDRFRMVRRWYHHLVFYGFLSCLAATTVAAIYDHLRHWPAPYPFLSWPVILGTVGGAALLIGSSGLLYLKIRMDREPAAARAFGMDVAFLALLWVTSFTGLLLLVLRETSAMGTLLTIHLGGVLALFITMPYGKFVHALYRYAALVRNAREAAREEQ